MNILKKNIWRLKKLFTSPVLDRTLAVFTHNKDYNNLFVKMLPSNLDYKAQAVRRKKIDGIYYDLYLNQWMEYALYFGIKSEDKSALYEMIKEKMIVFDVGVNFGETILNFAKLVGINGKVYGFEPVPYIYNKCMHNITLNNFKNIILQNAALSDADEKLIINDPLNGNSGGVFTSKINLNEKNRITIDAITLDHFTEKNRITRIDFLKIDVEGFETNVLKGGMESLKKFRPVIYVEVCDANLKRGNSRSFELIKILESLGYKLSDAKTGRRITTENINDYSHTDVVAVYP